MTALESQELQQIRELIEELLKEVRNIKYTLLNQKDDGR